MTDLEMTRLCAEAMELTPLDRCDEFGDDQYDPLTDDAQAMALVKRFGLDITRNGPTPEDVAWFVDCGSIYAWEPNLNRAIVTCVAQMQANGPKGE